MCTSFCSASWKRSALAPTVPIWYIPLQCCIPWYPSWSEAERSLKWESSIRNRKTQWCWPTWHRKSVVLSTVLAVSDRQWTGNRQLEWPMDWLTETANGQWYWPTEREKFSSTATAFSVPDRQRINSLLACLIHWYDWQIERLNSITWLAD